MEIKKIQTMNTKELAKWLHDNYEEISKIMRESWARRFESFLPLWVQNPLNATVLSIAYYRRAGTKP